MLKGYKTAIFNGIMGLLLLFRVVSPDTEVPTEEEVGSFIDQLIEHWDMIVTIAGNIWLRFVTKTPIFKPT